MEYTVILHSGCKTGGLKMMLIEADMVKPVPEIGQLQFIQGSEKIGKVVAAFAANYVIGYYLAEDVTITPTSGGDEEGDCGWNKYAPVSPQPSKLEKG